MRLREPGLAPLLLVSVFVIATCGLVYELIAGTLASYLLGDSVMQFSTIIGTYLFAMGIGSWLSRFINHNLLAVFVKTELLIGVVGGSSAAVLFLVFEQVSSFRIPLYLIVAGIGVLVGVEIPLLLRILKDEFAFKDLVSKVFTFDYVGALFASILFPLILVPYLGLVRSSFMFGMFNVLVALWLLYIYSDKIAWVRAHRAAAILSLIGLMLGFIYADRLMETAESAIYQDRIIYAQSTPYQRIIITKAHHDLRLFLNGNLQFSSRDEYRYHEALVHPGLAAVANAHRVLILGGGDGLAAREVLKYPNVTDVTQIELDPAMITLFSHNDILTALNDNAFASPRLHVINRDAFVWLKENSAALASKPFDFIIVDFPDPANYSVGKLYSLTFFKLLRQVVAPGGAVVVQSTSPYIARQSFWCVNNTLGAAGFTTTPYHLYVPSFGEWGFVLASPAPLHFAARYLPGMKFITPETVAQMQEFPVDMGPVETEINRLDNQALVRYFDAEWAEYGVN